MDPANQPAPAPGQRLADAVSLDAVKVLNPAATPLLNRMGAAPIVLVVLAAGKGTRFGPEPKCIQSVAGKPIARHSIDAFRALGAAAVVCVVGYQHETVAEALGSDNLYVLSANPAGGTAQATYEAFALPPLRAANPQVVVAMGDRILTADVLRRLLGTHGVGPREADVTFLAARYTPPSHRGKGRVVRGEGGRIQRIIEQRDIDAIADPPERHRLDDLTEGNCPLYIFRAAALLRHLGELTNANAQQQFYLTDVVEAIGREGGEVRAVTLRDDDPDYRLLCADVTRPADLPRLEALLALRTSQSSAFPRTVEAAAQALLANRPPAQAQAIAGQVQRLWETITRNPFPFEPHQPVALGVAGGRLRIAFMHPDMCRFFGAAWQMPIGAGDPTGTEQILLLTQTTADRRLHLCSDDPKYCETLPSIDGDLPELWPDEAVADGLSYEAFGTRLSERVLETLGYVPDRALEQSRTRGQPLPPPATWVRNNLRRPFPLVANALASLRAFRHAARGERVQARLGPASCPGLRMLSTGNIPQGGFASSSALTLATENAVNALFDLGLSDDDLVEAACRAEYGTGVRAGSLDQATEQKGRPGAGCLISSNPKTHYRILGTYPVPSDRFRILFPYSVPRDLEAWRWSGGLYAESAHQPALTTTEMRKLTGKAAEIAAILLELPLDGDLFDPLETEFVHGGRLSTSNQAWIAEVLRRLPLSLRREDIRERLARERDWLARELVRTGAADGLSAETKANRHLKALLDGWREPVLCRPGSAGAMVSETGVPLRAMVAYLFAEVARNFRLIHEPDRWIYWVTWSQRGDRCFDIDPARLPARAQLETTLEWEVEAAGPERLNRWLQQTGATPFDYQRGLADASLETPTPFEIERLPGGNFFRGLALIDLAEAMLHRAFGPDAVAVRINAAGQGDFFQVHVDTRLADVGAVQGFLRVAFYRRFDLAPKPEFAAVHPGGGAVGVRLDCCADLPLLVRRLREESRGPWPIGAAGIQRADAKALSRTEEKA